MDILIACIARQVDAVYLPHRQTLRWQDAEARLSFLVVNDGLSEAALDADRAAGSDIWPATRKPETARYTVREDTHEWTVAAFHWLAQEKQRVLDHARQFDAVLLVDSDLFLSPGTLRSLLDAGKPVVSGVFWTRWLPDAEPQPNVWRTHPYGDFPDLTALAPVNGLGACTLIRREALNRGAAYWPLLNDLPTWGMWQGEDRHFSIRCNRLGIELWADARPTIWHCYRPSDVQKIPEVLASLQSMN